MATTDATTATAPEPPIELHPTRSAFSAARVALGALILRDLVVLKKHTVEFVIRTLVQPFLLCFVFLYVFPKIGQGVGGGAGRRPRAPSPPSWSPGWWASPSCSRGCRRWP